MKKQIFLITLMFLLATLTVHAGDGVSSKSFLKEGVSLGSVIAVVISWDRNKSILLAIIHALLSWIYVIYVALAKK